MDRKLASLQRILTLQPIPDADAIEVATILGWHVVVKKNEFKVGDLVVFCEIDSLLPIRPEWAFLQSGGVRNMLHNGKQISGYRLKTIKLRGQISQGIAFPVSVLQAFLPVGKIPAEGTDLTDLLGIVKYDIPVPAQLAGKVRGNFPGFIPKTDEPRIQAYPHILENYQDALFCVTEKIDGSICTFVIKNSEFHVCSRNLDLLDDGKNSIWRLAKEMDIENKMRKFSVDFGGERYAIQGEIFGESIQGNPLKIKGQQIKFFNVYNFVKGQYTGVFEFEEVMVLLGLPMVPITYASYRLPKTVDEIVSDATKRSTINPEVWAEGMVFRPISYLADKDLGRLSFKAINPQYLLKHE